MKKIFSSLIIVLCFFTFAFAQNSPLKILENPLPQLPEGYDAHESILLKVTFLGNGEIGNVSLVKGSPQSKLAENTIAAAKKIRFQPKIIEGKSISVTTTVEYYYRPGSGWEITFPKSFQETDEKAEAILNKAVQTLGGEKYLKAKSLVGEGKFSIMRDGAVVSFQNFVDVIVFPNKERTEFKFNGVKNVQTNAGDEGWIFDGAANVINVQNETQINDFKRGMSVSLDNLLRGHWRGKAELSYVGRREATLGKRNDVVKLTYADGFEVEFEFSDEGLPVKAIYKRTNPDGEESKEEDRYAQFVDVNGIKAPFIIDHFSGGVQTSRINYITVEYNKSISDSIFTKPSNPKELKKDLKL